MKTANPRLWDEQKFDEMFFKDENRKWISYSGKSYGSETPEMGRAELFRFFDSEAERMVREVREELKKKAEELFRRHGIFYNDITPDGLPAYNLAIEDVIKLLDSALRGGKSER